MNLNIFFFFFAHHCSRKTSSLVIIYVRKQPLLQRRSILSKADTGTACGTATAWLLAVSEGCGACRSAEAGVALSRSDSDGPGSACHR